MSTLLSADVVGHSEGCTKAATLCAEGDARYWQHIDGGEGKGVTSSFDLAAALTKKEANKIRKSEAMIQYWYARMPMYGAHESEQFKKAEGLKDTIKGIEKKAKERWDKGLV